MNEKIIVWCITVSVLISYFVIRYFYQKKAHNRKVSAKRHEGSHLIEIGKEREMFYLPGDYPNDYYDEN